MNEYKFRYDGNTVKIMLDKQGLEFHAGLGMAKFIKEIVEKANSISALQARVEALETAFDAACDYVNHSPCDPDITPIQNVKWNIFKDLREAILKGEK